MSSRAGRAIALLALLTAAAAVALSWGGCGSGARGATGGTAGNAGGTSGSGGSATSGAGGSGVDSGLPYGDAEPCGWPGWYRAPMLPKGCMGVCIPDDVSKRVDPLVWEDRPDWCAGCKTLETPWAGDGGVDAYHTAVGNGISVFGQPDLFSVTQFRSTTDLLGAVFDAAGHPKAAWRENLDAPCGRMSVRFSNSHAVLDVFGTADNKTNQADALFYYRSEAADVDQLLVPGKPTFTWPGDFVGMAVTQGTWADDDMVAEFFADVALGYPSSGDRFYVSQLPGAPGGEWSYAQVVGTTAFVSHYDYKRMEWYTVTPDRKIHLFLGAPDRDILALVTDGNVIVWKEGRDPVTQTDGSVLWNDFRLYSAPYTTDPIKLVPRLLLANVPPSFSDLHIANGMVEGGYYVTPNPKQTAEIVVRLSDGRAWLSDLPNNVNWCLGQYPGTTELWGAVTSMPVIGYGQTLARVPYTSMQVLQNGFPDGGIADAAAD